MYFQQPHVRRLGSQRAGSRAIGVTGNRVRFM
jgi:hypothetical protein